MFRPHDIGRSGKVMLLIRNMRCRTNQPAACGARALLFLDQIKREKGVWWMPWQQEAMKDVILCDKRG